MKLFHVETKYEGEIEIPESLINELPEEVMLSGTVQFREQIPGIKEQLESAGKNVQLFQSTHGLKKGQMLGCDIFNAGGEDIESFLYVGDGMFHPTAFLYDNDQPVYYYNPFEEETKKLTGDDLDDVKNQKKGSLAKFHASDKIGAIVTTKPGQNNMEGALELKKRVEEDSNREVFIFITETLDIEQLNNFPFIECWVNTACPRIIEDTDKPMINLWDLRNSVMEGYHVSVV